MVYTLNLHLSKKQHFPVSVEQSSKIFNLMLSKGDITAPTKLQRPAHPLYEEITFPRFLESRIIPNNLYDASLLATGEWYYSRYKDWFDDFLWQVFQLCKREQVGKGRVVPCEQILDEKPGSYFFLAQLDAYRDYKDTRVRSNLNIIFEQGHIAPLLFLLNFADCVFEQRLLDTGEARSDDYRWNVDAANFRGSDEHRFRIQLLKIAYATFQSETTENVIASWNKRTRKYRDRYKH